MACQIWFTSHHRRSWMSETLEVLCERQVFSGCCGLNQPVGMHSTH